METVITTVIVISIFVLLLLGLSQQLITSQAAISDASRQMQERLTEQSRTSLTSVGATVSPDGDFVDVTLQNTGSTKLADYEQWDVILRYTDTQGSNQAIWQVYSTQWTNQIYQSTSPLAPEVIEPGIFNPGEYMIIHINVSPSVGSGTTNLATVATPNGITATGVFTR